MQVCETGPSKSCNSSGRNQWRIEEDQSVVRKQAIFWRFQLALESKGLHFQPQTEDHEAGSQCSSRCSASRRFQGKEYSRYRHDAAYRWQKSHRHVWYSRFKIIFPNVLEIETSIKTSKISRQSNQHLRKGRVDIHEEFSIDVFRGVTSEAIKRYSISIFQETSDVKTLTGLRRRRR